MQYKILALAISLNNCINFNMKITGSVIETITNNQTEDHIHMTNEEYKDELFNSDKNITYIHIYFLLTWRVDE